MDDAEIEKKEEKEFVDALFTHLDLPEIVGEIVLFDMDFDRACKFMAQNVYIRQRNSTDARREMIYKALKYKLWHGNTICLAKLDFDHVTEDGKIVREMIINGGNTLKVVMESKITAKWCRYCVVRCKTPAALALAYSQYDRKESTRSTADQCRAFVDMMPEVDKWAKGSNCGIALQVIGSACGAAKFGLSYRSKLKTADMAAMVRSPEFYNSARFARDLIFGDNDLGISPAGSHMRKAQTVISTVVATHIGAPKLAEEFWNAVKSGANLDPDSPQLELYKFLCSAKGSKKLTMHHQLWRCRQAWNAFVSGRKKISLSGRVGDVLPELIFP